MIPIEISGSQRGSGQGLGESSDNSGFRVHTIDLGNAASGGGFAQETGGSGHSSGGSAFSQGGRFHGQTSGSSEDSRGTLHEQSQSSSSHPGQGNRRQWQTEGSFSQSGTIPPTFFHNSLEERYNIPVDSSSRRSVRSREKRQIENSYAEMQALVKCSSTNCVYIRCVVGILEKDKEIAIALRSRLNVRAIRDVSFSLICLVITKFEWDVPFNSNLICVIVLT